MEEMLANTMDVDEIDSPPRATKHAHSWGPGPGCSLEIPNHDVGGHMWDFERAQMRERLWRMPKREEPLLRIGGPMCTGRA